MFAKGDGLYFFLLRRKAEEHLLLYRAGIYVNFHNITYKYVDYLQFPSTSLFCLYICISFGFYEMGLDFPH